MNFLIILTALTIIGWVARQVLQMNEWMSVGNKPTFILQTIASAAIFLAFMAHDNESFQLQKIAVWITSVTVSMAYISYGLCFIIGAPEKSVEEMEEDTA